jgi:hypothetical protein
LVVRVRVAHHHVGREGLQIVLIEHALANFVDILLLVASQALGHQQQLHLVRPV